MKRFYRNGAVPAVRQYNDPRIIQDVWCSFFGGVSRPLLQFCTQMKGTVAYVWNVGSAFFVLKRSTRNSLSQPVWLYIMASQASHQFDLHFAYEK